MSAKKTYLPRDFDLKKGTENPCEGAYSSNSFIERFPDVIGDTYSWEIVSACMINERKKANTWKPMKGFNEKYNLESMVDVGLAKGDAKKGYLLTNEALAAIYALYPAKK